MSIAGILILILIIVIVIAVIVIVLYFVFRSPPACTTPGAFRDAVTKQCYVCPKGMSRTLDPVTAPKGCQGACTDIYGTQSFEDGLTGQCYHCPKGMNRTLERIDSDHACQGVCPDIYGPNSFQDFLSGKCYSCPNGYVRTAAPVTAPNACINNSNGNLATATFNGLMYNAGIHDGAQYSPGQPVN